MSRLLGKVAIITGAASGIGKETVKLFLEQGAKVVAADISQNICEHFVQEMSERYGKYSIVSFFVDVSNANHCSHMINKAIDTWGRLDILFNNAGIMLSNDGDAVSTDEDTWNKTMDVNLKSVFFCCKYGVPAMKKSGGGVIINTASFVGLMGSATAQLAYTASKGGVLSMSRELAAIHAKDNIRVIPLCPGPLHTELLMKFLDTPEKLNRRLIHLPMGRFGYAKEIANTVVFLASDEASYITGTPMMVDGGLTSTYITPE
jgi:NAD(P)-dependent dehydrogenase (short-subunit alcohol dehydrogenase family)